MLYKYIFLNVKHREKIENTAEEWSAFIDGFFRSLRGQWPQCPADMFSGLAEVASCSDIVLLPDPLGLAFISVCFPSLVFYLESFICFQYPSSKIFCCLSEP